MKSYSASYLVEDALKYGLAEAILLNKLRYLQQFTEREDGYCWRTKDELANEIGLNRYNQDKAVKHLEELGVIKTKNTYIRGTKTKCRHFKIIDGSDSLTVDQSEKSKVDQSEKLTVDQSNIRIIKQEYIGTKVPIGQVQNDEYGKPEINEMLELWEQNISPITANKKKNRNACSNLLRKYGKDQLVGYIRLVYAAKGHRYAPAIADFVDLQYKADKLRLWAEKQTTTGAVATKAAYEKQNQQNYQIDEDF